MLLVELGWTVVKTSPVTLPSSLLSFLLSFLPWHGCPLGSKPGRYWHHLPGLLRPLHRHPLPAARMDLRQLHVQICGLSAAGKNLQISVWWNSSCSANMITQSKYHFTLMDSLLNLAEYVYRVIFPECWHSVGLTTKLGYFIPELCDITEAGRPFFKNRSKLLEKAINSYCHHFPLFILKTATSVGFYVLPYHRFYKW